METFAFLTQKQKTGTSFWIVLFATFVTFSAFYAPQPLLPLLGTTFNVSASRAALLITVTFLILCIAPLLVGFLLQRVNSRSVLITATALLGLLQFAFTWADSFDQLLLSRTLQGLLFPAIFTSAVTYCSQSGSSEKISQRVTLYIATTIVGGLGGRLFSGVLASQFYWQLPFKLLGIALLCCSVMLLFGARKAHSENTQTGFKGLSKLLRDHSLLGGLALIFTCFFAFSATLNALPFRLVELEPAITPAKISWVYAGYFIGIFIAANAAKLAALAGSELRAMTIALSIFIPGVCLLSITNVNALIGIGFITSAGFFLIHATLSGYLNRLQPGNASLVNGLYISLYYGAGALGSVLPLWLYERTGWTVFLAALVATSCLGFFALNFLAKQHATQPQ